LILIELFSGSGSFLKELMLLQLNVSGSVPWIEIEANIDKAQAVLRKLDLPRYLK